MACPKCGKTGLTEIEKCTIPDCPEKKRLRNYPPSLSSLDFNQEKETEEKEETDPEIELDM